MIILSSYCETTRHRILENRLNYEICYTSRCSMVCLQRTKRAKCKHVTDMIYWELSKWGQITLIWCCDPTSLPSFRWFGSRHQITGMRAKNFNLVPWPGLKKEKKRSKLLLHFSVFLGLKLQIAEHEFKCSYWQKRFF